MMAALLVVACGEPATKIAEIDKDISRFIDKPVIVKGEVVETFSLPSVKTGAYQIDDGTGRIWVVREGDIPARGERVKTTGAVAVGVKIGSRSFGTVMIEKMTAE